MNMRLADFIRTEIEPLLKDWEAFAETLYNARHMSKAGLRDHAKLMLLEIADNLDSFQSESERDARSKGIEPKKVEESWAEVHGGDRQTSGFSVVETVSEFRALRASVVSSWTKAHPTITGLQLEDLTRFHEAIDQSVAESLDQYAAVKEMDTRLFEATLLASPDPICVLDLEGRFVYANKATADLFAMEPAWITGKSAFDLGFSFAADLQRNLGCVIANQAIYRGKFTHRFASGKGDRFEYVLAPVLDDQQNTEATVCIARDVTEQSMAEEKVWHSAHHDPLTGLPNRRLFLDRLEQEIKHAKRSSVPLALLFMDLDGFKEVNDALGHEAGDRLLTKVAERLAEAVRNDDTIARLGGDEFTMILLGAKQRDAAALVAQSVVDALSKPFELGRQVVQISVSIGIAFYPHDATSHPALIEAADHAMYQSKGSGSGRVSFFNKSDKVEKRSA